MSTGIFSEMDKFRCTVLCNFTVSALFLQEKQFHGRVDARLGKFLSNSRELFEKTLV